MGRPVGSKGRILPSFVAVRLGERTWRLPFLRKNGREQKGAETTADLTTTSSIILRLRFLPEQKTVGVTRSLPQLRQTAPSLNHHAKSHHSHSDSCVLWRRARSRQLQNRVITTFLLLRGEQQAWNSYAEVEVTSLS